MSARLGIDIGGTNIKAAFVGDDGAVVAFESSGWSGGAPEEAVSAAGRLVDALARARPEIRPAACGCGCAGLVDSERGVVRYSPNLPAWRDVELGRMLEERLGLPVTVENDANAAAYGEYVAGAARGARNAVMLTLGTGVGGGIVLSGRLYRGSHGSAGEIGHGTIDLNGPRCTCGASGCLEQYVSARGIVAAALALLSTDRPSTLREVARGRDLTARDVGRAAVAGDALASEAMARSGVILGVGLANLVQVLDPDVIVLGGGLVAEGEPLLEHARSEMQSRVSACEFRAPRLVPAELGETAGVVGAALLARGGSGPG